MRLDFDRGTLVLRDPVPSLDCTKLPGMTWDARVGLHRAPAYAYGPLRQALTQSQIAWEDAVAPASGPLQPGAFGDIALRGYQDTAVLAWEMSNRRGLVALPTGSGKTHVALAAAGRAGVATLVLVPTRVLLEQWRGVLSRFYKGRVGCLGDGEHDIAPITVATFESAYRHMPELGRLFNLLIVDEAHHFGTGARDEALEASVAPWRLGLTATTPHTGTHCQRLSELIGPVVYELSVGDLAGTYLASFDVVVLNIDLTPSEREAYDADAAVVHAAVREFFRANPLASWQDFARAASQSPAGQRALALMARMRRLLGYCERKADMLALLLRRHRDAQVLVFTPDNASAYAIARRELVMPITTDIQRAERRWALDAFRTGTLRALVSAQVLNEGLDVPEADVAIVVGGSRGGREHVQRVGRLLRPREGKRALVYELVTQATVEVRQAQRRRRALGTRASAQL